MIPYKANACCGLGVIFKWRGSVLKQVIVHMLLLIPISILVVKLYEADHNFAVNDKGHKLFGFFVAFLLVFRSGFSVKRYEGGRKMITGIYRSVLELVRKGNFFSQKGGLGPANMYELRRKSLQIYFLVMLHLRYPSLPKGGKLTAFALGQLKAAMLLNDAEYNRFLGMGTDQDRVMVAVAQLSEWLHNKTNEKDEDKVPTLELNFMREMEKDLANLSKIYFSTDEIKSTPIPFPYVQMLKMFLVLFLYTVPFAMVHKLEMYTVPVICMLTIGYVGLDEIANEIEDPFGTDDNDLDLEEISDDLANVTWEMLMARGNPKIFHNEHQCVKQEEKILEELKFAGDKWGGHMRFIEPLPQKVKGAGGGEFRPKLGTFILASPPKRAHRRTRRTPLANTQTI